MRIRPPLMLMLILAALVTMGCGSRSTASSGPTSSVLGSVIYRGCPGSAPEKPESCDTGKAGVQIHFRSIALFSNTTRRQARTEICDYVAGGHYTVKLAVHTPVLAGPTEVSVDQSASVTANYLIQAPYR